MRSVFVSTLLLEFSRMIKNDLSVVEIVVKIQYNTYSIESYKYNKFRISKVYGTV